MRELNFFLRFQIKETKDDIFINQRKYIKDLLKRFGMEHVKIIDTLMRISIKLDIDENSMNVDITKYRGMIISLLYLIASRHYIMFCACFQTCLKELHVSVVKHIFFYFHFIIDLGLWYQKKVVESNKLFEYQLYRM